MYNNDYHNKRSKSVTASAQVNHDVENVKSWMMGGLIITLATYLVSFLGIFAVVVNFMAMVKVKKMLDDIRAPEFLRLLSFSSIVANIVLQVFGLFMGMFLFKIAARIGMEPFDMMFSTYELINRALSNLSSIETVIISGLLVVTLGIQGFLLFVWIKLFHSSRLKVPTPSRNAGTPITIAMVFLSSSTVSFSARSCSVSGRTSVTSNASLGIIQGAPGVLGCT